MNETIEELVAAWKEVSRPLRAGQITYAEDHADLGTEESETISYAGDVLASRLGVAVAALESIARFEPDQSSSMGPYEQIAAFARKVSRETLNRRCRLES